MSWPSRRAPARTRSISSSTTPIARPAPSRCVGSASSTTTAPSDVTAPAAVVVPPTSIPRSSDGVTPAPPAGSELAEVPERDAERRDGGAGVRRADSGELDLALSAVAAVAEIGVEAPGVTHELRYPRRQRP